MCMTICAIIKFAKGLMKVEGLTQLAYVDNDMYKSILTLVIENAQD